MLFYVDSNDCECYISLTSDRKLNKNAVPCQAVANKLTIERLPSQFQTTHELERILVSGTILFKKVTIMPKNHSLTLKGSMCNI